MKYKLSEVAYYSKEKIKTDELSPENYLSTENMLPEFGGITTASSLPTISTVTKYQPGDILLSNIRPYFKKLYYSISEGGCSNDVLCLCAKDNINKAFLYYSLKNDDFFKYVMATAKGTKMPRGDKSAIMDYELEVPDLETQKKIVHILSALDQKIELNNRLIDLLYSLGDAFYEKIQNDNPRTVTLKDISINYDKKRVPLSSRQREERRVKVPYYGATSILDYVDDYLFDGEYVLLGEDGTVMTNEGGAVLQYIWGKNWVNNHAHVLQGSEVSTEYLLFALRSVNVSTLVTGAVQPKINQENMNKIKLSIGSEDKMSEAEESIKTIVAQIRNLTNENKSLSDMRDTLLPKLMSGEINLNEITINE